MTKINVSYLGDLRTRSTHLQSGEQIISDAPVDNNGKGDAFSPTDLLATSYANCMITIIGIYCQKNNIAFDHCEANVEKHMTNSPRRIGQLDIELSFKNNNWSVEEKTRIEKAALNCPVAKSVSSEIQINVSFNYNLK
ncbi:MAG: OsmC family protein [Brumimicrobium sp.]